MSLNKVIEIARNELGNTEYPPGSNRVKYWEPWGAAWQGQPWCVAFLWWCFREAGESAAFFGGAKTASCGTLLRWYRERGQTVEAGAEVRPGDILILDFSGTGDTQHCGLVEQVVDRETGWYRTIEGNTAPGLEGSQDNGGCVALKRRYPHQIVAVCRPKYKEEEMPKTDYEGHWAEQHIRWAMDEGIAGGFPDGTFRPDEPMTRAQMVTMLHRYDAIKSKGERGNE